MVQIFSDVSVFFSDLISSLAGSWGGLGGAGEYTVTGQRCLYGGCKLNPDVNYWYCQTAEDGAWDYCCRPGQRCGFSQNLR